MDEHVAIIKPDERGRFALLKFIAKGHSWKLFVSDDGCTIRLEAVGE